MSSTAPSRSVETAPDPRQIRSWQDAEHNAAAWMRYFGFRDAVAKPGGSDGGVDVRAKDALGQVKYQATLVGRPELQRLFGARGGGRQQLLFFTGSDYASTAVAYADEHDIALFVYGLDGSLTAINGAAHRLSPGAREMSPDDRAVALSRWEGKGYLRLILGLFLLYLPFSHVANGAIGGPYEAVVAFLLHPTCGLLLVRSALRTQGRLDVPDRPGRAWLGVVVGFILLLAPIGSFTDGNIYTGPSWQDGLKFIGLLMGCGGSGAALLWWSWNRGKTRSLLGLASHLDADRDNHNREHGAS